MGSPPRVRRGPRTFHQRNSPSQTCGACTIAIPRPSVHIYAPTRNAHTLCPIRHSWFFTERAYHLSKSASSHLRLPIGAKSRKIAAKFPSDVESCRESWPRRRNFWEVESWTVESARARMLTPSSRDFLYGKVQIDRLVVSVIGREEGGREVDTHHVLPRSVE